MPRPRVLSFLSQWGGTPTPEPDSPTTTTGGRSASHPPLSPSPTNTPPPPDAATPRTSTPEKRLAHPATPPAHARAFSADYANNRSNTGSPSHPRASGERSRSRASSMVFAYQPPTMEIAQDTPPELQPIFTYLNSHANKLYQEGYFLKLHDLDSRGRPSGDRVWTECFAQLVGTVLSLWDAAQLDAAGEDGEVVPTFINLTDASIKMIESLPMNGVEGQNLQNVLSISTAANNRYLLHFNSLHSLTQWTAGIRLAMFEHATLQEAYTGSILAGKGKQLNGIKSIMERSRFPTEDWARVRFGAGTPWRRCWCVITPPTEKDLQKAQKVQKKRSAYDRSTPGVTGDIKFYDTRKVTKKTKPIATITNAFSAYAIYPQSKPLIDQSTLVKVEGMITIHSSPESTTEGFVFVMPEVHPAVTGFEIMLRWLIPVFDTFALYGRPARLIADVVDTRSLMFAMPTQRRYGYLELIDVAGLIHTEGSQNWSEREWRKQLKVLTSKRMTNRPTSSGRAESPFPRRNSQSSTNLQSNGTTSRSSLNLPTKRAIAFGDDRTTNSTPASRHGSPAADSNGYGSPARSSTAPQSGMQYRGPHKRAVSDAQNYRPAEPSRLSFDTPSNDRAPPPPPHGLAPAGAPSSYGSNGRSRSGQRDPYYDGGGSPYSEPGSATEQYYEARNLPPIEAVQPTLYPTRPVQAPPAFAHKSGQQPPVRPNQMPDLRRANSAIDAATLAQLKEANQASNIRNRSGSGSHDDSQIYPSSYAPPSAGPPAGQQYTPHIQYNPQYSSGYDQQYGQAYSQPYYTQPPPPQMQPVPKQRRGDPQPAGRGLPTIPGTPAFEQGNQFEQPELRRGTSANSISRKPVPSRPK